MKAVSIKCPNCAARVSVKADQDDVTCTYCGTTSVVRRRSKVLERPLAPPKATAGRKVATARHSSAWVVAIIGFCVLPGLAAAGFGVYKGCLDPDGPARLTSWEWDGVDAALLADLNGDGVQDALGRVRKLQPDDELAFAAFDGRNGERLWKSEALGKRGDVLHSSSGLSGDTVIVGATVGELVGLSARDGSTKWRIRLAEKVKQLCQGEADGTFLVHTADKRAQVIALADGRVEGGAVDGACRALPGDSPSEPGGDREIWAWHSHGDRVARELPGMSTHDSIHHPPSGVTIAVGNKQPGTSIAMIGRYTPGTQEALWTAVVPAGDPLAVPPHAAEENYTAVDGEGVAVAYNVKFAHHYRVTLFAAADGRRLWDAEVPGEAPMSAVRMSPTHVFVSSWDGLFVYDRAKGALAYRIR